MNELSKNKKKILLLTHTREDVKNSLKMLTKFEKSGSSIVVLGIDFQSQIELRKHNIPYKVPTEYFDKKECENINSEVLNLACNWYKTINKKLTYIGISLGEMAEYSFYHIFVDALRNIKIANSILDIEKTDAIWLPKKIPLYSPYHLRYECLSKAINYLAKLKGIHFSYYQSNKLERKSRSTNVLYIVRDIILKTLGWIKGLKAKTKEKSDYKYKVLFFDIPLDIYLSIKQALEKNPAFIAVSETSDSVSTYGKVSDEKITELREVWKNFRRDSQKMENLIFDNIPVINLLSQKFSRFFYNLKNYLNLIDGMYNLIQTEKPSMLVTMYDVPGPQRAVTKICRNNGIPTLVIQHGLYINDYSGFYVMPKEADKHFCWGNYHKNWAIKRGKLPETQIVTGNPKWDSSIFMNDKSKNRKLSIYDIYYFSREFLENLEWHLLRIKPPKKLIVIATQYYKSDTSCYSSDENVVFIRDTLRAMKDFPKCQVVVKLHPNFYEEYKELTKTFVQELRLRNVKITSRHLWDILKMCNLLITQTSTVGLEAMLFNKSIVIYIPNGSPNLNPYAGRGAVIEVYKKEGLISAIKDALFNKEVQMKLAVACKKFINEYAYRIDGKASYRIAKLIESSIIK
ncbi:MAG: hypothetical protein HWN65_09595 [Candidatus Helarchaeota archaeon]|nr:hypothetical protein [Candidatus Helarchaeota archaeon]